MSSYVTLNQLGLRGSSVIIARLGWHTKQFKSKEDDCGLGDERALLIVSLRALAA